MSESRNKSKMNKTSRILILITAFLAVLYVLSFTKSCSSSDKREIMKTALVNQKYRDTIDYFLLQDASGILEFTSNKGFWTLQRFSDYTSSQLYNVSSIPVSSERMNNFLNELVKVRNLYKISDKINKNSSLGLTNGTEFHISYPISNAEGDIDSFRELIFGNQDFSLSSRYMMTGESTQVYEIDDSMDIYLTTSVQSWAEPYIISREASSTDIQQISVIIQNADGAGHNKTGRIDDKEKLMELRHGGLPEFSELVQIQDTTPQTELDIKNGDKSSTILEIYKSPVQEGSYIIKAQYFKPSTDSAFYTAWMKISTWTYNKIIEITL